MPDGASTFHAPRSSAIEYIGFFLRRRMKADFDSFWSLYAGIDGVLVPVGKTSEVARELEDDLPPARLPAARIPGAFKVSAEFLLRISPSQ
jgi:hypothetical protein